jgi:hypothetical protein
MKRELTRSIFAVLFILSGVVVAYGQCAQVDYNVSSGTEQEAPSIHCPEAELNSNVQVSALFRSYATDFGKALVNSARETNTSLAVGHFREITFVKPFFQRNLYQLEQVYRL